ncbi:phytoene dehydrogenase [Spiroplasma clarkii]|uniref:Monoamine oxidase n=1 Tax=Spiroplasma clarkii TaxID=2139 RepID=A0A1Y0KZG7_9MOLU|nr:NAD(P)/FAD-dependent oxidoreductase [Spiroplasma clarkii]ARU91121.1 phytoene dehydrogenase [Spiroplasma clarkii]ATX70564.1 monoamine oxidase [Spiroplasma clarkii]
MKIGIIGAGISGLASAMKAKELGMEFTVFDGRDQVGGRLLNKDLVDGSIIELGGQWFNHHHKEVQKLIDNLGLLTFATPVKADFEHLFEREVKMGLDLPKFKALIDEICYMADQLDLNDLMNHPKAKNWDAIDFNEWIMYQTNDQLIKDSVNVLFNWHFSNFQVDNTSLLNVLFFIKSNNAVKYFFEFSAGLNEQRIVGGLVLLAKKLARQIGLENILLNSKVLKIEQKGNKVIIHTNQDSYEFDHVIIGLAPEMTKEINFEPPLPPENIALMKAFSKTKVYKFSFTYETKFWDGHGFNLKTSGYISKCIENTTVINKDYVFVGFVIGDKKDVIMSKSVEERKQILLDEIKTIYDSAEAYNYSDFSEYNWDDEIFKDGYFVSKLGINDWNKYHKIWSKPVGNIHFSGAEFSKNYNGFVEGGVQRGYEVIDEILKK